LLKTEFYLEGGKVKVNLLMFPLMALIIASCVTPIAAQGVTAGFTVYVNFLYPLHVLYNLQVTVRDQTGRVVATAISPDGSMVIIPIRTETSIYSLTASASGYASGPLTYWVASPRFWRIGGTSTIPVQTIGGDYWITIRLY
jgi:hypothetical protein